MKLKKEKETLIKDDEVTINIVLYISFIILWLYGIFFLVDNKAAIVLSAAMLCYVWSIEFKKNQKEVREYGKEKRK